jgi:hypothetical protein
MDTIASPIGSRSSASPDTSAWSELMSSDSCPSRSFTVSSTAFRLSIT